MRRWVLITMIVTVVVAVLLPSGYVGYLGWKYTHPSKRPLTITPEELGLSYQDIVFPSEDDHVNLRGWLVQSKEQNRRIVIFAHGYKENRESADVALNMADRLHRQGIASLLFDFRGAGESDGEMISFGYHEKDDLLGAIAYAKSLGYDQIGLVGFSMGAATALLVAPEVPEVEVVIADSAYTDLSSYVQGNLSYLHREYGLLSRPEEFDATLRQATWFQWMQNIWQRTSPTIEPLLMAIAPKFVVWEVSLITGIKAKDVQPITAISEMKSQGVFLIHSEGDSIIPVAESEELEAACTSDNKLLWISQSPEHVGTYNKDPREYLRRTTEFLTSYLPEMEPYVAESEPEASTVWKQMSE